MYENFTASEISTKVAELVKPECLNGTTGVQIIYQSIENLHEALRDHWEIGISGDYPTLVVIEWFIKHSSIITKIKTAVATDFE